MKTPHLSPAAARKSLFLAAGLCGFLGLAGPSASMSSAPAAPAAKADSTGATGSVVGTVVLFNVGDPVAQVPVILRGTRNTGFTDANGSFVLTRVPPGSYRLQVRDSDFEPADDSVTVSPGKTTTVKIEVRPRRRSQLGSTITGKVTGQAGTVPIRHAHVQVTGGRYEATSDDKGFFTIYGIGLGNYEARFSALGYESVTCSLRVEDHCTTVVVADLGASLLASETKGGPRKAGKPSYRPLQFEDTPSPASVVDARDGIHFTVSDSAGAGGWAPVTLEIADQSGQLVRKLVSWELPAGSYSAMWDSRDESGDRVPTGLYRSRLQVAQSGPAEGWVAVR